MMGMIHWVAPVLALREYRLIALEILSLWVTLLELGHNLLFVSQHSSLLTQ